MITLDLIRSKIVSAITRSKLSYVEIARKINVRPTQITSYIKGRKLPALDTLAKLCAVLEVDANTILCVSSYEEEPPQS